MAWLSAAEAVGGWRRLPGVGCLAAGGDNHGRGGGRRRPSASSASAARKRGRRQHCACCCPYGDRPCCQPQSMLSPAVVPERAEDFKEFTGSISTP